MARSCWFCGGLGAALLILSASNAVGKDVGHVGFGIALGAAIIAAFNSLSTRLEPMRSEEERFQHQWQENERQLQMGRTQLDLTQRQLDQAERQLAERQRLLEEEAKLHALEEENARKSANLIEIYEGLAERFDKILSRWESEHNS